MIQQYLDISTAHVSKKTAEALNSGQLNILFYHKSEYGWFIYAGSEEDKEGTPEDLQQVIKHAKQLGCVWVVLDCDGEEINELPVYEW